MLLREIFAARGKTATSSMVRVVKTPSGYIRFQEWQAQEQARLEASKRYQHQAKNSMTIRSELHKARNSVMILVSDAYGILARFCPRKA